MDILGIGNDIIEIERIATSVKRFGSVFLDRLFTPYEQAYCEKNVQHFAGRFAAKEAVSKALGTGICKDVGWHDIEIRNHPNGKPHVILSERLIGLFSIDTIYLSISHCKYYAAATAVITRKKA